MSSSSVRTLVKDFLSDYSLETVVDLTGEFDDLRAFLADSGVQPETPWLGLQFIGDNELPVSLSATNEKGLYREFGSIILHVCAVAKIGAGQDLLDRAEDLRNLFRGRNIGSIVVEGVTPMNTSPGATLEFEGGYVSGTITVSYHADSSPGA